MLYIYLLFITQHLLFSSCIFSGNQAAARVLKDQHYNYFKVYYLTHQNSHFAGNNFHNLLRIDHLHLFSRGLFNHILARFASIVDEKLKNTHNNTTMRNRIKNIVNFRTIKSPRIIGFNKRFSQFKIGIYEISSPWGYQLESFFILAPHIFTLDLLTYGGVFTEIQSKLFLNIVITIRTIAFNTDPLITRIFNTDHIRKLQKLVTKLRHHMQILLPNVCFPKNHWLVTLINSILHHGVGLCDSLESMHK
jgi:hypothetical protein